MSWETSHMLIFQQRDTCSDMNKKMQRPVDQVAAL